MINLILLREKPEEIKKLILKKEPTFEVDKLIALDEKVRKLKVDVESLRKTKNDLAAQGAAGVTPEIREKSIEIGRQIKSNEQELIQVEEEFKNLLLSCPNLPQEDIPEGNKESNKVVKSVGEKPEFNFTIKNHLELNEKLSWLDFEAAANMSGANFVIYKGACVKLIYALTQLMMKNNSKYGFEPIMTPYLVTDKSLVNSGNLPKFEGDFYKLSDDGLNLIPTAEVPLTNLYAGKVFTVEQLPIKHFAWTSCFRREAGGYGALDRGLIRIHQFEKVEIYSICEPEKSNEELDLMVSCAEDILQQLGLHYRVSLLAAQDCSFSSSKTFDIEVWLPGQNEYYEVSSASNCTDFQARRASVKYKKEEGKKPKLVHTLNTSSLALPRLIVALMENYQQEDGTIVFPENLQKIMDSLW